MSQLSVAWKRPRLSLAARGAAGSTAAARSSRDAEQLLWRLLQQVTVSRRPARSLALLPDFCVLPVLACLGVRELGALACTCARLNEAQLQHELAWKHVARAQLGVDVARTQRRRKSRYFWRNVCRAQVRQQRSAVRWQRRSSSQNKGVVGREGRAGGRGGGSSLALAAAAGLRDVLPQGIS